MSSIDELSYAEKNWVVLWFTRTQQKPAKEYKYREGVVRDDRTGGEVIRGCKPRGSPAERFNKAAT